MAKEHTFLTDLVDMGYEPIENRAIVVRFQPKNLSGEIADFFSVDNYYVLQICKEELVLLPVYLHKWKGTFQTNRDDLLAIPFTTIKEITSEENGVNYLLTIRLDEQTMAFKVQQKELSGFRTSGAIGAEANFWGTRVKNWHKDNFDHTLADLLALTK
ncbi:hypothetical protein I6N95_14550 [Vagococcus sp. BWB3-3]|uniref:Uncharacterized protein n=1 Tax=Vagococcus allomyrinae TaxID=2794353 RepID=A0A940SWK5_9ENTE|nr:hypothetical protein [Vagococcus allomyrinae]MBP1042236.1 hypothetical protein [Vagococcus allomyrinae]